MSYYVREFNPASVLKKYRYCPKCGAKLLREKHKRTVTNKDDDFKEHYFTARIHKGIPIGSTDGIEVHVTTTRYVCSDCDSEYTFDELRDLVKSKNTTKNDDE